MGKGQPPTPFSFEVNFQETNFTFTFLFFQICESLRRENDKLMKSTNQKTKAEYHIKLKKELNDQLERVNRLEVENSKLDKEITVLRGDHSFYHS